MKLFLTIYTLWIREMVRFIRQPNRVFGAVGQPLLFWLVVGTGFSASFRPTVLQREMSYLEYFFPGILVMILLFTAIFSTFSIIEDRNEGFLQGVLVSPASRWGIVLGKIFGGASLALIQALLFLAIAPFVGFHLTVGMIFSLVGCLFLIAASLTSFGFCLAWRMDSVQGFHALMMLILLPMWFLSGAFFPLEGLAAPLKFLMKLNPLTYGLSVVRQLLYGGGEISSISQPSMTFSLVSVAFFGTVALCVSWWMVAQRGGK